MNALVKHSLKLFAITMASQQSAFGNELNVPSKISCQFGSVIVKQISPVQTYELTKAAAYTLTVNGITEPASGLEYGNITTVLSKSYYVFTGTGGFTFAKNSDHHNKAICTNSKYGKPTPGFIAE